MLFLNPLIEKSVLKILIEDFNGNAEFQGNPFTGDLLTSIKDHLDIPSEIYGEFRNALNHVAKNLTDNDFLSLEAYVSGIWQVTPKGEKYFEYIQKLK